MARPGLRPFGHVLVQLRIVWHRYRLMALFRSVKRSGLASSRESAIQRYDWSRTAGPRYSSEFHQYDGHAVEQHAHRTHSYNPSSFRRSAMLCRYSLPCALSANLSHTTTSRSFWLEIGPYIRSRSSPLQIWLDGPVLLVEVGQVWHEVLDHVCVRKWVDLDVIR